MILRKSEGVSKQAKPCISPKTLTLISKKEKIMARKQGNPPTTHTVEAGDTLFDIAQAYYGDGNQ